MGRAGVRAVEGAPGSEADGQRMGMRAYGGAVVVVVVVAPVVVLVAAGAIVACGWVLVRGAISAAPAPEPLTTDFVTPAQAAFAIDLLQRALRLEIEEDDVERLWPEPPDDPYLARVREDLEFALEHVPAYVVKKGPQGPELWDAWHDSDELLMHVKRLRRIRALRGATAGR